MSIGCKIDRENYKKRNDGFTLVELLAVIVILAIVIVIAVPSIMGIIRSVTKHSMESDVKLLIDDINLKKSSDSSFDPNGLNMGELLSELHLSGDNYSALNLEVIDSKYHITIVGKNKWNGLIACGTYESIEVVSTDDTETCGDAGDYASGNVDVGLLALNIDGEPADSLDSSESYTLDSYSCAHGETVTYVKSAKEIKIKPYSQKTSCTLNFITDALACANDVCANKPKLALGMTAIKWNGTDWDVVSNPDSDTTWYDYSTVSKKWANAKTADGSYWVWIPRYAYSITSGYHSGTAGTIEIKFLKGDTNIPIDSTQIHDTGSATDTYYVKHPAFTFDDTELTGIWVAKFTTTGTAPDSLESKPGASIIYSLNVKNMFTYTRNMEKSATNRYGFGTESGALDGAGNIATQTNNVDTHMMKNTEWGAVAYLSKSIHGKNDEITYTTNATYAGGGAGTAYTTNGVQSTTGNIYGVYDMSGGYELTMANYNNTTGNSGFTVPLSDINNKYIDRYTVYDATKYGDAIYETSNNTSGSNAWYSDYSSIVNSSSPWFLRDGGCGTVACSGPFAFASNDGAGRSDFGWRIVLVVADGL